jgi:hypothetical protein
MGSSSKLATAPLTTTQRADTYLAYLATEWASVPQVADSWDAWDEDERLNFQLEWGIREDRLGVLEEMARTGALTSLQCERLADLQRLIAHNQQTIERLFAESRS